MIGRMSAERGVVARQAMIGGRFSRFVFRALAVLCWLLVLALPVLWLVGAVDRSLAWWQAVLYLLGAVVIVVPIGFIAWFSAGEEKEDTERLRRAGRPAIAEIVGIELSIPRTAPPRSLCSTCGSLATESRPSR